ncbi:MAG: aminoglycoside O-phosphotransferase APH(9)-Ia [Roseiflexaceae bacterium]
MHEPPTTITAAAIEQGLSEHYQLRPDRLEFLPLGHDSSAWVYRVEAAGQVFFLKLRRSVHNPVSLLIPRFLHDQGVERVVAPLPTSTQQAWAEVAGHAMILYPFVEGQTGMQQRLNATQWHTYGAIVRQIHSVALSAELAGLLRREQFFPDGAAKVAKLDQALSSSSFEQPLAQELADFWQQQRATIQRLLNAAIVLGGQLAHTPLPLILCHADIHTNNVLVDQQEQVWIVDWDEVMLAPKERDLMFLIEGISTSWVTPAETQQAMAGYGPTQVDQAALSYYRAAWALSDIGDFGDQVLFRTDLGQHTRQEALRCLKGLFQPGEIVAIAEASLRR